MIQSSSRGLSLLDREFSPWRSAGLKAEVDTPWLLPNFYSPQEHSLFVFVEQASCLFSIALPDIKLSEILTFELVARFDSHFKSGAP